MSHLLERWDDTLLLNCVFASSKTESTYEGDREDYICPRDEGYLSVPESTKEGMREKKQKQEYSSKMLDFL